MAILLCATEFSFGSTLEATTPARTVAERMTLAQQSYNQNKWAEVIELLDAHTDEIPNPGLQMLARAYRQQKDIDNELRILNIWSNRDENNFEAHGQLGLAYIKKRETLKDPIKIQENDNSAIQSLRTSTRLNTKNSKYYETLLSFLIELNAKYEARELIYEMLVKFPQTKRLFSELCRLETEDGLLSQAMKTCRMAIQRAPNETENYTHLVRVLIDQKEDQMARSEIVKSARRFPTSEDIQHTAGNYFLKQENYPVAIRYYKVALKADPASSRSQIGLAKALAASDQEEEALVYLSKACLESSEASEVMQTVLSRLRHSNKSRALQQKYTQALARCGA